MPESRKLFIKILIAISFGGLSTGCEKEAAQPVDFNTDIRPILNANCLPCHGGVRKNAGFSLLFEEEALAATKSGVPAIIPGFPDSSEFIRRIEHHDPEMRMPQDKDALSDEEIDVLRRWVADGAKWGVHWAYVKPEPITPPETISDWPQNPIDNFILRKLSQNNLQPSEQAEKAALIRRASLDLTGLPPTLEQAEAFFADSSENAYEKMLDDLLDSPAFGERWAAMWLDLARYADSKGYEKDDFRTIWRYRDWVIDAFNADMPFDRFTVEQIAGDMLPEPTENQLLATAFHRNTMTNDEGGTDDEEFRTAAVIDRVNTTWEVWQGTTMACVQCHSHPYDPFKHEDYYRSYAFLNNTRDADQPSEEPTLPYFTEAQNLERERILAQIDSLKNLQNDDQDSLQIVEIESVPADSLVKLKEGELAKIRPVKTPIMRELPPDSSRETFVFERGSFLTKGEKVSPGPPPVLNPLPPDAPQDRLGFAKWLVSQDNPLTARVVVNRFWEQIFGIGLIETTEDFGSQGLPPSHPELLDWLALHFQNDLLWSVKGLLKTILTSSAYRQNSAVTPELLEKDPRNRLLARGPRFRLSAEQIRDQALAISGLLSKKMYGPSVKPYQPDGVWQIVYSGYEWKTSPDEDSHRRGLYTFWRRTSPYPSMVSFDSPSREFCVSRRIRTNTPLQALVTLNDPVYVEAAQALARRMIAKGGDNAEDQIRYAYRRALLADPDSERFASLNEIYHQAKKEFSQNLEAAKEFANSDDENVVEIAALTMVANVILNLDAVIMKS